MEGRWTIHCDGSALPRRGRTAIGAVLVAPDGARHTLSRATGERGDGNEAEAAALIAALEAAIALGARDVLVACDSVVVVEQTTGRARTTIEPLASLCARARELLSGLAHAEVTWVPRRLNAEADELARRGLGLPPKGETKR